MSIVSDTINTNNNLEKLIKLAASYNIPRYGFGISHQLDLRECWSITSGGYVQAYPPVPLTFSLSVQS